MNAGALPRLKQGTGDFVWCGGTPAGVAEGSGRWQVVRASGGWLLGRAAQMPTRLPLEILSCCHNMSSLERDLFEALELLRNGAAVTGQDAHTDLFRQRCLQLAFHRMCMNVVPELVARGLVMENVPLRNLMDVSILFQNQCIRPELAKAAVEALQTNNREDAPA